MNNYSELLRISCIQLLCLCWRPVVTVDALFFFLSFLFFLFDFYTEICAYFSSLETNAIDLKQLTQFVDWSQLRLITFFGNLT